jgi:hypothetical protein
MKHKNYQLVFGKPDHYKLLAYGTLEECISKRKVSGDLVLDPNGNVCKDDSWLWDWEKKDPKCYAQRAIIRWSY